MPETQKHPFRREAVAVHSLDSFAFTVPNLGEAQRFFGAFGLDVHRLDDRLELRTHGHPHCWGVVHEAPGSKQLQYLSFACFAEDFDALVERIERRGVARCDPHPLGKREGIWIRHPDGFPIQVLVAEKSAPDAKSEPLPQVHVEPGRGRAPNRSSLKQIRPRRLSHVLLFTASVDRAVDFYEGALGLRVGDRSSDVIAFMHGIHGSDHHMVAVAKSDGPGLHHTSWDVGSIDEVGMGMERMVGAGYRGGWGVGRHVLGSNYFYYVRDPWGSYCEYSFDIDYVPVDLDWPTGIHPLEDSFYIWGPDVPSDFTTNYELRG